MAFVDFKTCIFKAHSETHFSFEVFPFSGFQMFARRSGKPRPGLLREMEASVKRPQIASLDTSKNQRDLEVSPQG